MEERANGPSIFGGCPTPFFYSHTMAPWKIVVGIPGCGCKAVHGTAQSAAGRRALGLSLSAASDRALGLPRGSPRGVRVKLHPSVSVFLFLCCVKLWLTGVRKIHLHRGSLKEFCCFLIFCEFLCYERARAVRMQEEVRHIAIDNASPIHDKPATEITVLERPKDPC